MEINKIYCMDAIEFMKQIDNKTIDFVLIDPPFKLSQEYSANVDADNLLAVSSIFPVAQELFRVTKDDSYLAVYYDMRILPLILEAMKIAGWKYLRGLTFYRRWGNAHKLYGWMSTSDFILIFRKPSNNPLKFYSEDWRHDVYIKDKPEKEGFNHPAQKPILDVKHLINHLCPNNGLVLDCYVGSGTTAVVCKESKINFICNDNNEEYVKIANQRLNQEVLK